MSWSICWTCCGSACSNGGKTYTICFFGELESSCAIMSAIWGISSLAALTMIDDVRWSATAVTWPFFFIRSLVLDWVF